MAHAYAHLFALPATGLRFFTVYGPWGRPDMAVWSFTAAIVEGRPIRLFNDGRMRRDFTYIDEGHRRAEQLIGASWIRPPPTQPRPLSSFAATSRAGRRPRASAGQASTGDRAGDAYGIGG